MVSAVAARHDAAVGISILASVVAALGDPETSFTDRERRHSADHPRAAQLSLPELSVCDAHCMPPILFDRRRVRYHSIESRVGCQS